MALKAISVLPPMVPFPEATWRLHLAPDEWKACLDAWISLSEAHLSFSDQDFLRISTKDESLSNFLLSYTAQMASNALQPSHDFSSNRDTAKERKIHKQVYLLSYRLVQVAVVEQLLRWEFLAGISKLYNRTQASKLVDLAWERSSSVIESSINLLKSSLVKQLESNLKVDLDSADTQLRRLNHLLHVSPPAATFFMAGSDFLDALISGYKHPQLQKLVVTTTYLCLLGLTASKKPNFSSLIDQLYSLSATAEGASDSLIAELVTISPILQQVRRQVNASESGLSRANSILDTLEGFRKMDGKDRASRAKQGPLHVHRMSLISQIQDLFPDLGTAFVVKLLDEYNDDTKKVILHLLEESPQLQNSNNLESFNPPSHATSSLPTRHNIYDSDDLDRLAVDTSQVYLGRRNPDQIADDILRDRSTAPKRAAILSALAAFDSDDDERDDTYDVEDIGGTVDSVNPDQNPEDRKADPVGDNQTEALFKVFKATPNIFSRDAQTRRSKQRAVLREQTGMTDEAIEGWAVMLSRDPRQLRRLEAKYATHSGAQPEFAPTAWRAPPAGSGTEDSDMDDATQRRGGFRGRGGRGRGRGRGGNVASSSGEQETTAARHQKEANKGSRANHNRRDQRARKMARGGFPG